MFTFANLLLLGLFLAAVFDFCTAYAAAPAGAGRLRFCAAGLWCDEHFLFGAWAASLRLKLGALLFYLALAVYEFEVAFCNSMARENWPWLQTTLSPVLDWVIYGGFGLKILFGTRYRWRNLLPACMLYFIARWVYFNGQNIWWLGLVVGILAAKDILLPRAMRAFLAGGLPSLALVVSLHFAGIVAPDALSERDGSFRQMFGYGHPNTFGGIVLGLLLAYLLLRAAKLRWWDAAAACAVGVFLLVGPQSRSSGLCAFGLGLMLVVYCLRGVLPQPARRLPGTRAGAGLLAVLPVGTVAAISYLLPLFVVKIGPWSGDIGPAWLAKLDGALTCRISLAWSAYRMYPVKIAGQQLLEWPAIDNTFVYLLYQFGPVAAALATLLFCLTLYRLARSRRWLAVACLLAVLVYAAMENQALHLTSNPAALLLAPAFYGMLRPPQKVAE